MKPFKMFWGSSYDRGLEYLLEIWEEVLKQIPVAELHICYGWDLFDKAHGGNIEMMKWKDKMVKLMSQKQIVHHGRLSKEKVDELTASCDVWAYFCNFSETNCITAINCQKLGVVPITMKRAGLIDTVYSGITIETDDEITPQVKQDYIKALVYAHENPEWLKEQSEIGKNGVSRFYWENIASNWAKHFEDEQH